MGNVSLKVLEFFVQKGYEPCQFPCLSPCSCVARVGLWERCAAALGLASHDAPCFRFSPCQSGAWKMQSRTRL